MNFLQNFLEPVLFRTSSFAKSDWPENVFAMLRRKLFFNDVDIQLLLEFTQSYEKSIIQNSYKVQIFRRFYGDTLYTLGYFEEYFS